MVLSIDYVLYTLSTLHADRAKLAMKLVYCGSGRCMLTLTYEVMAVPGRVLALHGGVFNVNNILVACAATTELPTRQGLLVHIPDTLRSVQKPLSLPGRTSTHYHDHGRYTSHTSIALRAIPEITARQDFSFSHCSPTVVVLTPQPLDLQSHVSSRQRLESQQQENLGVQKEFASLSDEANIYKLVGPVLLKQEKTEAVLAVDGRLEFIGNEM
jgi:hypothetical protein